MKIEILIITYMTQPHIRVLYWKRAKKFYSYYGALGGVYCMINLLNKNFDYMCIGYFVMFGAIATALCCVIFLMEKIGIRGLEYKRKIVIFEETITICKYTVNSYKCKSFSVREVTHLEECAEYITIRLRGKNYYVFKNDFIIGTKEKLCRYLLQKIQLRF